MKVPITVGLD